MTPGPQGTDPYLSTSEEAVLHQHYLRTGHCASDEVIIATDTATQEEGCRLIVATLDRVSA